MLMGQGSRVETRYHVADLAGNCVEPQSLVVESVELVDAFRTRVVATPVGWCRHGQTSRTLAGDASREAARSGAVAEASFVFDGPSFWDAVRGQI